VELGILRLPDNGLAQRAERLLEAPLGAQRDTQHLVQNGRTACRLDGGARPRLHFGKAAHGMERHQFLDWIGGAGRFHRGPISDREMRCHAISHQESEARSQGQAAPCSPTFLTPDSGPLPPGPARVPPAPRA